jgi:hypothetical protein
VDFATIRSAAAQAVFAATDRFHTQEWLAEKRHQATSLRHVVGNPFRPYPAPPSWPSSVVTLAEAIYAGEDCSFALRDALLEAGHPELAEHFAKEAWHPKGCWVVDLVLGKE